VITPSDWSADPNDAVRFSTREDAERLLPTTRWKHTDKLRVAEHLWVDLHPPAPTPQVADLEPGELAWFAGHQPCKVICVKGDKVVIQIDGYECSDEVPRSEVTALRHKPQVAAPPAATPARERLRKAFNDYSAAISGGRFGPYGKSNADLLGEMGDALSALLNEPATADGWEAMRELRARVEGTMAHTPRYADCHNARSWVLSEIDRLLSRSPAAQVKEAT
jgi:hypothetical protein